MSNLPENIFQQLFQRASVGIIVTDKKFRIRMINASAAEFFNINIDDVMGKPVEIIVPEHRQKITRKLLSRSVKLSRSLQYRIRDTREKGKRYLSIMVDPIKKDNSVQGVCLWIRDFSRRMELEKRLGQIEKLASLGQLAGGVAHHFNNILGGIVTAIDHALNTDDVETQRDMLETVSEGVNRAVDLTRTLLEFSASETPEQNLVDLTEGVISFVEKVEPELADKNCQIDLEIKEAPIVAAHPGKIRQILQALLANSVEAMGTDGGKIKIILDSDEKHVNLLFCDTGPGVPADILNKIFEPFFTTKGSIGGGGEGNIGLGLTIASRLAKDIGGTIHYLPVVTESGSCFVITFPIHKNHINDIKNNNNSVQ